ncbi:SpoIIE family protein phosphatase [Deltaproteobacteria bacterium TL4]
MDRLNLLIIDDEEAILNSLRFLFRRKYNVYTEKSAEEALRLFEKNTPIHLIISDQRMPGMKGHKFLKQIHEEHTEIVSILITGYSDMTSLVDAVNEGHIYGYIAKPWDPKELEMLLSKAESHYRLQSHNLQLTRELLQINQELEQRVAQRTQELHQQKQELEKLNTHLLSLHQQMNYEMEQARITQQTLLPSKLPQIPGIRIATKYQPMEQIGGDIYDLIEFPDHKLGIMLADVTGHGIPAALISFMFVDSFQAAAYAYNSAHHVLQAINEIFYHRLEEDKFVTAFYGILDTQSHLFQYATAGHPPGYVLRAHQEKVIPMQTEGTMLGVLSSADANYQERVVQLEPGDKLFLYTDAIIETSNEADEMYGSLQLEELLLKHRHLKIDELLIQAYETPLKFSNKFSYTDDVTLVGIEITEK